MLTRSLVAVAAVALIAAGATGAAPATDAQVKSAVTREISAVTHQKGKPLEQAIKGARASLVAAKPVSSKAVGAKTLGLQAASKASQAGAEQVQAEDDNTRMKYSGASSQTALATKNLAAAGKLLNKAAALLGISQRAP
jgi:hypothetical protein